MKSAFPVLALALISAASAQHPPIAVTNSPAPPVIALPPPMPSIPEPVPAPLIVMPPPPSATIIRAPQPRSPAQSYVTAGDYPPSALAARAWGRVVMRVNVGINGRVTACAIVSGSGFAALDSASCRIIQRRARYTPAIDSNGNPAAASVTETIEWRLP